ncbi:MAG: hypothetical protein DYH15_13680 [Nitrosomonas sp. PRO4]|nr:hypothetical protein [Nitrosomonas sp. PRO4]
MNPPTDISQLAATITLAIAPYLPYLITVTKTAGLNLAEKFGKKISDETWEGIQSVWHKIKDGMGDNEDFTDAVRILSRNPNDEDKQTYFTALLISFLQNHPEIAVDIQGILKSNDVSVEIIAKRGSILKKIKQKATRGKASISADHSDLEDVDQEIS